MLLDLSVRRMFYRLPDKAAKLSAAMAPKMARRWAFERSVSMKTSLYKPLPADAQAQASTARSHMSGLGLLRIWLTRNHEGTPFLLNAAQHTAALTLDVAHLDAASTT